MREPNYLRGHWATTLVCVSARPADRHLRGAVRWSGGVRGGRVYNALQEKR